MTTTVTLETWRARMSEDMRLHDSRPWTQEAHLLGARMFLDWVKKAPADLGALPRPDCYRAGQCEVQE